jgi:hypothetical protein
MIIELNEAEQRLAKFLAKTRNEKNRSRMSVNRRIGPQSDEITDLEGIGGELAFCKLMNIYPDMQTDFILGHDCLLQDGTKVDVKTTKYETGKLLSVPWKDSNEIDVFALMIGELPKYRYAGMMSAKELLKEHRKTNLGYGIVYMATQDELYK